MRFRSLVASWMFVLAIIVGLPKTLAALPISPTTSITIGDKLFDNFVFALVGDGGLCCRPPFGASEISVTPLTDGQGNVGVRFEGPFAKAAFADDGEPWGFSISFDVATLDGGQRIDGSRLSFDAVIGVGGFGEVISGISTSSGEFVTTLSVIAADTFTLLEDEVGLPVPLDRLRNNLLFSASGAGTVDYTTVDQTFTQTSVPQPLGIRPTGVRSGHRRNGAEVCAFV